MAVRKVKGSWWVDFMYNGERLRKPSPHNSKGAAEAFEAHLRRLVAQHGSVTKALEAVAPKDPAKSVTLATFAERWLHDYVDVNNKPSEQYTKRVALRVHLLPALGAKELRAIDTSDIDLFKRDTLAKGLKPKTVNNYLTILRKCLGTAVDWGILEFLPRMRLLKAPTPGFRYLTEPEVMALVAVADGVWRDMILFAARTGLRFSELAALDWADIDLANCLVAVRHGRVLRRISSPKNYRIRHVPLTNEVVGMLRLRRAEAGLVFSLHGRHVSPQTASVHLHAVCERADITPHGWHVLRHTFASHLAQRGASLQALKDLLGHSSITMVLRYAHLAPNYLADTVRLLEPKSNGLSSNCHLETDNAIRPGIATSSDTTESTLHGAKKDHALA